MRSTNRALTAAAALGADLHVFVAGGGEGTKAAAEAVAKLAGITDWSLKMLRSPTIERSAT